VDFTIMPAATREVSTSETALYNDFCDTVSLTAHIG
jgi:hypothetical protein